MTDSHPVPTPFIDWYGIWPSHRKEEPDGRIWSQAPPRGIKLSIEQARKSDQFVAKERPWEQKANLRIIMLLQEKGRLRLWYNLHRLDAIGEGWACYAESEDGYNWQRPDLGLVEYEGSTKNNILATGTSNCLHSLFVDPVAPPEERYKAVYPGGQYYRDGVLDPDMDRKKAKELLIAMDVGGVSPEERRQKLSVRQALKAAVSPDGIQWTDLAEPILDVGQTNLDTHNLCTYDPYTGKYVAYLRGHIERRRLVRRAEGTDFRQLQEPHACLLPDPQDPIDDDFYNPCYCPYPGRQLYLMFPSVYHRIESTVDIQLAVSRDSYNWQRPERRPIVDLAYAGGEYGTVYASPNLVTFDREWWLPLNCTPRRHDFLDRGATKPEQGELRWAIWQEDRLVGLEAEGDGFFVLVQRQCAGQQLRLNYRTAADGWIKLELVEQPHTPPQPVEPYEGFGLEAAETLSGDELSRVVCWNGSSDLSALKGKDVSVRIHMYKAKIFSIAF